MTTSSRRSWLVDIVMGCILGGIFGLIVAVNVVIFSGVEGGYEASLEEVFRHSRLLGIATSLILLAGPLVGVALARARRRGRIGAD